MDAVSELEAALGAEVLRARLLRRPFPKLADRYRIEAILGRGATGVVVAARDEDLARDVALKLTLEEPGEAALGEAKSLASLHHVNVVLLYDASVTKLVLGAKKFRVRMLCMQRVDGVSLRVWLREQRRSPEEIVAVFVGAGAGLAAAHAKHVVHRDFKPENVLVARDGTAKVLDFGFALAASSTRSAEEGRPSGVAGTFAYMAPEAREGRASTKSDQYSFGLALAEALSGELREPTSTVPQGVSTRIWRAISKATAIDPDVRFASMDELLAELRSREADRRPARREPRRGILSAVLIALAIAAVGVIAVFGNDWVGPMRAVVDSPDEHGAVVDRVEAVRVAEVPPEQPHAPMPVAEADDALAEPQVEPPPATCVADEALFVLRTHAGSLASRYELTMTTGVDCQVTLALRRTRTGVEHATTLDQILETADPSVASGRLTFTAQLVDAARTYSFDIPLGGGVGAGSFTSVDPVHGRIPGTVDVEPVSRFGPDLGHAR